MPSHLSVPDCVAKPEPNMVLHAGAARKPLLRLRLNIFIKPVQPSEKGKAPVEQAHKVSRAAHVEDRQALSHPVKDVTRVGIRSQASLSAGGPSGRGTS